MLAAELSNVTVQYTTTHGPVTALSDISVGFRQGTSTAIVGRSGSGKSTLVSVLCLMRRPTDGTLALSGRDVSRLNDRSVSSLRSTEIGIVFQSFHLDPALTAAENVMLPWFFGSWTASFGTAKRRAAELLERLGVGELVDRAPGQMSGGQRQRVAIGRALFVGPSIFVADEPTGNLDEDTANDVADTILSLSAEFGTTVVLVTHDAAVARRAERQLVLVKGALQAEGI